MRYLLFFAGIVIIFSSCLDKNKILSGSAFPFHDESGSVHSKVLFPTRLLQVTAAPTNMGKGAFLELGSYTGYVSSFAIKFVLDTTHLVTVDSAIMYLQVNHVYRSAPGELSVEVHEILNQWSDEDANPLITEDSKVLATAKLSTEDTLFDAIPLPKEFVQHWIDNPQQAYGVVLKYIDGAGMKEYYSSEGQILAGLDVGTSTGLQLRGRVGADSIYPKALPVDDISLLSGSYTPPQDRIVVDNTHVFRTFIQFSLDSLPSNATINRAFLTMFADKDQSIIKIASVPFQAHPLTAAYSGTGDPQILPDSSIGAVYNYQLGMDITHEIQFMTLRVIINYGYLIRTATEGDDISRYVFYSSPADTSLTPRLLIYYTLPVRRY